MAANLLIRELDDDTNDALDRMKEQYDFKANTDAALAMIKEYWILKQQVWEMENKLKVYDSLVFRFNAHRNMVKRAKEAYESLADDFLKV
ncbi:MAG: hypothetical protein HUU01_10395 [Saprospiraceae bacterium]|nr:hypothetical protein [Saprospiraceae bacterium]